MCLGCSSVAAWARGTAWVRAWKWKVCKVRACVRHEPRRIRTIFYSTFQKHRQEQQEPPTDDAADLSFSPSPAHRAPPHTPLALLSALLTPPHKLPHMRHGIPVVGSYIERRVHGTSGPSLGFVDQCRHGLIRSHTGMSRPPVSLAVAGKFPTLTRGEQRRGGPFPDAIGVDIVGDGCD